MRLNRVDLQSPDIYPTLFTMSNKKSVTAFIAGVVCFLIPALIYAFWIHSYNRFDQHEERVEYFKSHFPEFLQGRFDAAYVGILFLAAAVWLFARVIAKTEGPLKYTALVLQILSGLLLFLNVFSLL